DFESVPLGDFVSRAVAPGVTAAKTGTEFGPGGIVTTPTFFGGFNPPELGDNTTPGGARLLGVLPVVDVGTATLRFSSDEPIQAFGAYLTGLESGINQNLRILFDDGTSRDLEVPENLGGGVQFFGFTDSGASISQVSLQVRGVVFFREIFGVDDVRFVTTGAVPEPTSV